MIRIPGKIMLLGEYAALSTGRALACTVNRYVDLDWTDSCLGEGLTVTSSLWPHEYHFENVEALAEIKHSKEREVLFDHLLFLAEKTGIWKGGRLEIRSSIQPSDGFGSSSALRLALTSAFLKLEPRESAPLAFAAQRAFQKGLASGYDFATQVQFGLCLFQHSGQQTRDLLNGAKSLFGPLPYDVTIFSGNRGDATASSLHLARPMLEDEPEFVALSEELIDRTLNEGFLPTEFFPLAKRHLDFLERLPRFPQEIFKELRSLAGFGKQWIIKTSGAGGYDALIGFGPVPETARAIVQKAGWSCDDVTLTDAHGT